MDSEKKTVIQIVWGIALVLAGAGIFFAMPYKMSQIEKIGFSPLVVRFCFYLIGVFLIGGGIKKIYDNYPELKNKNE
ncbi:hypothetical protein QUF80_16080 [Desulfococcaceae bacterium HSG8]|nr:hypothetical protein [Desulfococcaceae bacterium HSG8]